jgi:hypothetical protein
MVITTTEILLDSMSRLFDGHPMNLRREKLLFDPRVSFFNQLGRTGKAAGDGAKLQALDAW